MAQATDYTIDNSTGANVRADINTVLQAIATNNSGSSAPSTTFATQFFADTNAGIMKLRNTSNNDYVNLFTLAGGVDVDAASNFNEDVTFTGASANIVFDKSDNALEFADNAKAVFGSGGDLEITHGGSNSAIAEVGTGNLEIKTNSSILLQKGDSEFLAKFISDGANELYYDNSKKFETYTNGVRAANNGHIKLASDSGKFFMGAGDDAELFHDGTNLFLNGDGTNDTLLRAKSGENSIKLVPDGAVELYHNNTKRLETVDIGIHVFNTVRVLGDTAPQIQFNTDTSLGTSTRAMFGMASAANNFVNGSAANDMVLNLPEDFIISNGTTELIARFIKNGAVELYFDNSKKIETTSSGISFSGDTFMPDGEYAHFGTSNDMYMGHSGTVSTISNVTGNFEILTNEWRIKSFTSSNETMMQASLNGDANLWYDNVKRFNTLTNGAQCRGIMHVLSLDGNVNQHTESLYFVIGTNSSTTFTVTNLIGSGRFVLGGYANAGQGALAFYVIFGGAMFATQHYQVNELINSGMQNISVSTSKNNTSYVVTITNSSSSSTLGISGFIESTGSRMAVATS